MACHFIAEKRQRVGLEMYAKFAAIWSFRDHARKSVVQTGRTPSSLGREPDPLATGTVGLTPEVGGFARLNHGRTPVVAGACFDAHDALAEHSATSFAKSVLDACGSLRARLQWIG